GAAHESGAGLRRDSGERGQRLMAVVHIPAAMRNVTADQATVTAGGATVAELINNLEVTNPGLKAGLVEDGRLRSKIALFVDVAQNPNRVLPAGIEERDVVCVDIQRDASAASVRRAAGH